MNSYILDYKTNLESIVVPTNSSNTIVVNSQFQVIPAGSTQSLLSISNTGKVTLGAIGTADSVVINSGVVQSFKRVTNAGTNYILTTDDYAIEIVNSSYNTITLPTANGIQGTVYALSSGSTNVNLSIIPQSGELIDGGSVIQLKRIYDHVSLMSNGISEWYII